MVADRASKAQLLFAEPFRLFFPLGLLLGALGVSLWPLFYWHLLRVYPATPHMRLMIEGLMGSFVIGFLGTAGPRLLETVPFGRSETVVLLALEVASAAFQLARQQITGDLLFLALLLLFLSFLVRRIRPRAELPPPSFLLVLGGFGSAIGGILLLLFAGQSLFLGQLGRLLLNEGFILFPLLGVGAFFFPKLLEREITAPTDPRRAAAAWRKGAALTLLALGALWASFVLEALGWTRSAALLRGLTSLAYLVKQGQLLARPAAGPFLARCFQLGALLLITGLFLPAVLPNYPIANLHVVLIGGFNVILFTVSTRVVLGHSGERHLLEKQLPFLIAALGLLVLALLTRVSADVFPRERESHLVYAALIWLIAAAAWARGLGPKLRLSDD